jgi:sulfur carrier protein
MKLIVNGEPRNCGARTLFELWQAETGDDSGEPRRGYAIALNGVLVQHGAWRRTELSENDQVEIVRAMQGG